MVQKKKKTNASEILKFWKVMTSIYVGILFCVFPFYFQDFYFNMLEAKASFFITLTQLYFYVGVLLFLLWIFFERPKELFVKITEWKNKISVTDVFVFVFALVLCISTIASEYTSFAWSGEGGWDMGAKTLLLCVFSYFMISRFFTWDNRYLYVIFSVLLIVFLHAVLNHFKIDPLSMHEGVLETEYGAYVATIGNVNWYAGYLSIFLGMGMSAFVFIKNIRLQLFLVPSIFLGFMNIVICNSDSAFLAVSVMLLFLFFTSFREYDTLKKYFFMGILIFLSFFTLGRLQLVFATKAIGFQVLQNILTNSKIALSGVVFMVVIYALVCLCEKKIAMPTLKKVRIFIAIALGFSGTVFLLFIYLNNPITTVPFFMLVKGYITITGNWGSSRGYIWQFAIAIFNREEIIGKLLGVGADCFRYPVQLYFSQESSSIFGSRVLVNAHSEFLQYLVTLGVFGVFTYYGILFSSIVRLIRFSKNNLVTILFAVALLGFFIQGLVNNPVAIVTPYFFAVAGLGEIFLRKK